MGEFVSRVRSLVWPEAALLRERINDLERRLERCCSDSSEAAPRISVAEGSYFVASRWRRKFHKPECKWIRDIPASRLLTFDTREDALATGRKPCKTCGARE